MEVLRNSAQDVIKAKNNALADLFRVINNLTDGGKKKITFSELVIEEPNDMNDWEIIDFLWIADYCEMFLHYRGTHCSGDCAVRNYTTDQILTIIGHITDNKFAIADFEDSDFDNFKQ